MKLLIFTYAPAGLGHLRVTDALADSMPKDSEYVLLGSMDRFITWIHRFTSINSFGNYIFLKSQYGLFEEIFTNVYRKFLTLTTASLYRQVKEIVIKNSEAKEIWVIATHFGIAHQVGAFKERLMRETDRKIKLIVQVTDDTSQRIWCVWGADMTFVPSKFTQVKFQEYAARYNYDFISEVIPYPLSSSLTKRIPKEMGKRSTAFENDGEIKIAVPISGAMVGLAYITDLIRNLAKSHKKFRFFVLVKQSPFTQIFISLVSQIPEVTVITGKNDAEMVSLYELMYEQNIIHMEITKPSEQAFKAIISPRRVGGSILLLTDPVGRQESENIEFLKRHGLVAGVGAERSNDSFGPSAPRAIKMPQNPYEAAKYILYAIDSGIFANMARKFHFSKRSLESGEIGPKGAKMFWKILKSRFED